MSLLEKYTSAVLTDAQTQHDMVLEEIRSYRKAQMEKAEEEILGETYAMIQKEIAAVRYANSRRISLADLERRKNLLLLRKQITEKVFAEASERIAAFVAGPEYADFVCGLLRRAAREMPEGKTVLFVRKEDRRHDGTFLEAYGRPAVCETDGRIRLGGVIVYNRDKGIVCNHTLDLRLNDQKDWFTARSGLSIG